MPAPQASQSLMPEEKGIREQKSFFGLQMEQQRDVLLFIVEDFHANSIMDAIYKAGDFEKDVVWHFHG
jgi:hypothetical protein